MTATRQNCQARRGSDGQTRCAACRIVVDADEASAFLCVRDLVAARDAASVPATIRVGARAMAMVRAFVEFEGRDHRRVKREVNKADRAARLDAREPFVSALAPDPWSRNR